MDPIQAKVIFMALMAMLWVTAGYFKGMADDLQHDERYRHHEWTKKWKMDGDYPMSYITTQNPHWWYLGLYNTEGFTVERFPFSSTALVWLTDKWHLYNFIQYRIYDLSAGVVALGVLQKGFICVLVAMLVLPVLRFAGFQVSYRRNR